MDKHPTQPGDHSRVPLPELPDHLELVGHFDGRALSGQLIRDLANTIAAQAEAIRDSKVPNRLAAAKLLNANAGTLVAWLDMQS